MVHIGPIIIKYYIVVVNFKYYACFTVITTFIQSMCMEASSIFRLDFVMCTVTSNEPS